MSWDIKLKSSLNVNEDDFLANIWYQRNDLLRDSALQVNDGLIFLKIHINI